MSKVPLPDNGTIQVQWGNGQVFDYDLVSIHYRVLDSGVAVCTLNEPQRLNALTTTQQWEYMLVLEHAKRDDAVKALVWTGHGRAFSSGADLSGKAPPPTLKQEVMDWFYSQGYAPPSSPGAQKNGEAPDFTLKGLTLCFWDFPKPSVVAVNGLAVGGAANIALANFHDLVFASTEARFKYPFADIGVTPELGSSFLMPRMVGMTRAKKMMMTCEWISAADAKDMGLVLEVLPPEELLPRALAAAELLASKRDHSMRLIKRVMNHHVRKEMEEVLDEENRIFNAAVRGDDPPSRSKL
eukprot:TRINITY_DN55680_c0_g1_i1.p1 TRINITY_DN55680_c0_g1~~TRINITY_DN55680_c0_g1_i1.p1  ORF type:complete len:297 (+),score=68.12 TRINITY_DN55680_c0_g1_i1:106-996(+)